MTTVHLLHPGYTGDRVGSSVVLVRDGGRPDHRGPGHGRPPVADHGTRWAALDVGARGRDARVPEPPPSRPHDELALFPNAEVVDFWARYRDDLWLDHDGDGYRVTPARRAVATPGHTAEDTTLVVGADDAVYAMTHLWWHQDRTPEVDPWATTRPAIERGRARVLAAADVVIPGPRRGVPACTGR